MTLRQLYDQIEEMPDEEHDHWTKRLLPRLCPVSQEQIMGYAQVTLGVHWGQYRRGLDRQFKECIIMETTQVGTDVRSCFKLSPLSWDTEL